jgi:hypothetical protein
MSKQCIKCGNTLNKGKFYCSNQCRADATLKEINSRRKTAYPYDGPERSAYYVHRFGAKGRGIGWNFTFESWLKYWQDSGRWEQRGRHRGEYVMFRINDEGHTRQRMYG